MSSLRHALPRNLLARLLDAPDLVETVHSLPAPTFAKLIRELGVEDAGELIALATQAQLVAAFDEELFRNDRPGERETFDASRFTVWLEVLLEAGAAVAAQRIAALSEDFTVRALSSLILVLDHKVLLERMSDESDEAYVANKAIESTLSEEIDGYLLLARKPDGWDAVLSLVLALDRDQRALLERLLDRLVEIGRPYVDDLASLPTALSPEASLAEDVEAERDARRGRAGYVEPRDARAFLALCRAPETLPIEHLKRDPITLAYFRELAREPVPTNAPARPTSTAPALVAALDGERSPRETPHVATKWPLADALAALARDAPDVFSRRLEEFTFVANVLYAGDDTGPERLSAAQATHRALEIVAAGALAAQAPGESLVTVLRTYSADLLFRAGMKLAQ